MSMIPILFEVAWKSLLVAGATLAVLRFAKDRTAGERSWIAHGGLTVLFALPLAAMLLPAWSPAPASFDPSGTAAAPLVAAAPPAGSPQPHTQLAASPEVVPPAALALPAPETVALWLYLVPLALLAATMLLAVLRLASLRGRAQVMEEAPWLTALARAQRRMGFKHGTALLVSDELRSPISWGVVRPIILLNPAAIKASGEAEAIIAHELAHVARLDWAKLLVARAACALLWFNPLVWMLAREAHQLREEAADDAVLMSEVDGVDYAALLVNAARHDNHGLLIAAHGVAPGKDSLKRRISRVLDGSLSRRPATAAWSFLCLGVLIGLAAPLAAFDPFSIRAAAAARPSALAAVAALPATSARPSLDAAAAAHAKPLTPEQLIQMRAVGVTRRDIEAMEKSGSGPVTAEEAIQAKALGVTTEYAAAMRRAFPEADFGDISAARAMGIRAEEATAMRRAWPGARLDDLAGARAVGVTPAYAAEMRRVLPGATIEDLTGMRAVGVDARFVREMERSLGHAVSADQAMEARAIGYGLNPDVRVKVREATAAARAGAVEAIAAARRAPPDVDIDIDVDPDVDVDPNE
jgi:beta-lactamase regulating signal transducer with metallopeptidase domain